MSFLYSQKRAQRFEEEEDKEILYRMARRKNPHPQRAVNVKTVVVGDDDEEEEGGGEEEEEEEEE